MSAPDAGAARLAAWRERGRLVCVHGRSLFAVEAGPSAGAALLLLHGFPSSSLDFHRVLPALAAGHRVIAHDHLGFGFSQKPPAAGAVRPRSSRTGGPEPFSYSLLEQAEMAIELWHRLGVRRAHLLAHDYGTSVATEILARRERGGLPFDLRSVTLSNGSVLLELARLRLSQRILKSPRLGPAYARLAGPAFFRARMRRLWGDPRRAERADLDALWAGLVRDGGRRVLPALCRYLDERVRFRERWVGPLTRLDLPAHLLWGDRDPVAVPAMAEGLAALLPAARTTWLRGAGHYPMLEAPREWAAAALAALRD